MTAALFSSTSFTKPRLLKTSKWIVKVHQSYTSHIVNVLLFMKAKKSLSPQHLNSNPLMSCMQLFFYTTDAASESTKSNFSWDHSTQKSNWNEWKLCNLKCRKNSFSNSILQLHCVVTGRMHNSLITRWPRQRENICLDPCFSKMYLSQQHFSPFHWKSHLVFP